MLVGLSEDQIRNTLNSNNTGLEAWGAKWPDAFLCPTFKPVPNLWDHKVSYGYNIGDQSKDPYRESDVKQPDEKLMFADAQSWWIHILGADYVKYWDYYGESFAANYGETMYRHSEGCNIAYFDGHANYLPKEKTYYYLSNGMTGDFMKNKRLWMINH
jgi:prepilin-type processing-associated H-X9-DG protein